MKESNRIELKLTLTDQVTDQVIGQVTDQVTERIEMTQPDWRNSPTQKYRLTLKGKELQKLLQK